MLTHDAIACDLEVFFSERCLVEVTVKVTGSPGGHKRINHYCIEEFVVMSKQVQHGCSTMIRFQTDEGCHCQTTYSLCSN